MPTPPKNRRWVYLALGAAFFLRLAFGLFSNMDFEDQKQVTLIGLKYYCTGLWPYFGADVFGHLQVSGALLGILTGGPFFLWPFPEAPFLLVNLLSFSALCFFGWYASRKLPEFPRWILWPWIFTAPWLLNVSTNVYNVSYVLFGSVLFFIGFMETIPSLSLRIIPPLICDAMMGFAFFWNAQFHLSYTLLIPFLAASVFSQAKYLGITPSRALLFLTLGALPSGALLVPTYLHYGFHQFLGDSQKVLVFNPSNLLEFFTVLARYFSFASCEVPRFLGSNGNERLAFLRGQPWSAPFITAAFLLGVLQPLLMVFLWFNGKNKVKGWPAMRTLAALTFFLVYGSFLFAIKSPASHTYYLVLPVSMLYAFYAFSPWASNRWFKGTALVLLLCNFVFHLGLAVHNYQNQSPFQYRKSVVNALEEKDYHLVGERRPGALY